MPWRVQRLVGRGFRNLVPFELEPGPYFNVIYGDNGAGKSSLLELIHYVASLRSFRQAKTEDVIQQSRDSAHAMLRVTGGAAPRTFEVTLHRHERRKLTMDGRRPRSIGAWRCALQAVLFHPGDLLLASGPPEARRAFVDGVLEQLDPVFANSLAAYTRALRSRNRLLRSERVDQRSVCAYDPILATTGAIIGTARARFLAELSPVAEAAFADVIGSKASLQVRYKPRVEPTMNAIAEALETSWPNDRARGLTTTGPHRDDVDLRFDGASARTFASQGQQRAITLALKIAELEVLHQRSGRGPLLLLDDVSSELDRTRNQKLFEVLTRVGSQVFLTTTHPEFILIEENRLDIRIESGVLERRSV